MTVAVEDSRVVVFTSSVLLVGGWRVGEAMGKAWEETLVVVVMKLFSKCCGLMRRIWEAGHLRQESDR
jgi:hypothetical protein